MTAHGTCPGARRASKSKIARPVSLGLLLLQFTAATATPQSIQPPDGWSSSQDGANITYTPGNLPVGGKFTMTLFPAESAQGQDLTGWFTRHAQADLRQRGAAAELTTPQRGSSGLMSATLSFRDKGGQNWTLIYAAAQNPAGLAEFCVMLSNLPQSSFYSYVASAGKLFGQSVAVARSGGNPSAVVDSAMRADAPHTRPAASAPSNSEASSVAPLLVEAKGDLLAFRQKYAGRTVTLTGVTRGTYGHPGSDPGLIVGGKFPEDGFLDCGLAPDQVGAMKQVARNQLVTIAGRFTRQVYAYDDKTLRAEPGRTLQLKLESCQVVDFHPARPVDMTFPEPKPLGPSSPPLSGLYYRTSINFITNGTNRSFLFFSPDGHVYKEFPRNGTLDHFDFAEAAKSEPELVGYYRVTGNRIDFVWFADKPESWKFNQSPMEGWTRLDTNSEHFRPNWLVGTYQFLYGEAAALGLIKGPVKASGLIEFYTFQADGTFALRTSAVRPNIGLLPQGSPQGTGTYTLSGTTVTMKFADGRIERHTALPFADSILLDGNLVVK